MTWCKWMYMFWVAGVSRGWVLSLAKIQTIWGWPHGCKNLIFCGKQNCEFWFWFDYQCYWSFDNWKFIHACNWFENMWLNFLWWHLIWTACLYIMQARWWKHVLVVHGSLEGCTWIHRDVLGIGLKTYNCNYFYNDVSYKLHACM